MFTQEPDRGGPGLSGPEEGKGAQSETQAETFSVRFPEIDFLPSFLRVGGSDRQTDVSRPFSHTVPQFLLVAKGAESDTPGNDRRAPVPTSMTWEGDLWEKAAQHNPPQRPLYPWSAPELGADGVPAAGGVQQMG